MLIVKYMLIGLMCGVLLGAIIVIIGDGPAALFSNESSWLGPKKEWTRGFMFGFMKLGAILGTILGLIAGAVITFVRR